LREGLDRLLVICPSGYFVAGLTVILSLLAQPTRAPKPPALGHRKARPALTRITTAFYLSFRLIVRAQDQFGIATEPDVSRAGSRKEKPTASRPSAFFFCAAFSAFRGSKRQLQQYYFRSDCVAGGPLLLPGRPFMFDVSCIWSAGFCWFAPAAEPTVSPGFAVGPFLFPGWPAIPAPEFGALGAVETLGFVVCASAAGPDIASARIAMLNILFMTAPWKSILWQAESTVRQA
jgi:hypothetical protein